MVFWKHILATLLVLHNTANDSKNQKQPSRGVLRKRYSENMQQTYRRTTMLKCDFNKVEKHLLLRTPLDGLSLKSRFGGCGQGFDGCDGSGGLGGFDGLLGFGRFDGFSGFDGLDRFDGLDEFCGFDGFRGFHGLSRFGGFDGFSGFGGFDGISGFDG